MNWFEITNPNEVPSPALLLFHERVEANLREMLRIAGGPKRLRPHIKTHKLTELVRRQVELGITKFKCATIAEAEMAAQAGAADVLLAYQPVGPHIERLLELAVRNRGTAFGCLFDNAGSLGQLQQAAKGYTRLKLFLDLDVGQGRTGIAPGTTAFELYREMNRMPWVMAGGLHAYDGHLHDSDPIARATACEAAFAPVERLRRQLEEAGVMVPSVVAGGSPTFPMHARRDGAAIQLSPGTTVFWDAGYAKKLPDLDFLPAAVLLTRVVSKPAPNRLCLDLGHKAVASEMPQPRAVFLNLPDAVPVMHSEEHLVVETPHAADHAVGDVIYALPWHVCPTVALHEEVWVVDEHRASTRWQVIARRRRLGI
jgi:D-serine deaminase-like pyridoxal phosphate-dependent protein